ncbi:MAG: hypothetical protein H0V30_09165 [Chitinophagaceae bacterium]|jgi:hypothetical protein|nr:hypothetical protein [Chitinophagaceae bacterium]
MKYSDQPFIKREMNTEKNADSKKGKIREGQEDSSISNKENIKDNPYPGTSKEDKQFDSQEEFITPPVTHPPEK